MINSPKFWYRNDWLSKVLALIIYPLSIIWIIISFIKKKVSKTYRSRLKIICVGNLNIGGTGKTPFAIYTYKILKELGFNPVFLTRGYGGKEKGPIKVESTHQYKDVGDEALLLNNIGPTIVSRDRSLGAKFIENHKYNYDVILMDDGLQNYQLEKNIKFLLVDKNLKFGNKLCVPAGPLREPINQRLKEIDSIILTGNNTDQDIGLRKISDYISVFNSSIKIMQSSNIKGNKFLAFCGLANPDKFYETLEKGGYKVFLTKSFPDHHQYTEEEINHLILKAKNKNLTLITTAKDYVKIIDKKNEIQVLSIESSFNAKDELRFKAFLKEKLNA
ncbi:MAG: tetraacyldisaccharide 4'-kinase [Alphaproteobacteria bacterium]|nr:tetraacyldisaccharide 4'-kinase [Alphaproteobacteria bacterium]